MKRLLASWSMLLLSCLGTVAIAASEPDPQETIKQILQLVTSDEATRTEALTYIDNHWQADFTPMVLEAAYLTSGASTAVEIIKIMDRKTGQNFGYNINTWYEWLWNRPPQDHPLYAEFKSRLYGLIDPKFSGYFSSERVSKIRLDEVRWGGVRQDGIPPLRSPNMIKAAEAEYLQDDNIVFGLAINGAARAYPKRILAWHEMFVDEIGGVPVAGVYCTLCGTVIPYVTTHKGINHQLGTSGFLYRSNKLMYDQETQSLWNTLWGSPVIGPLAEQDITLERLSIVTTTWGEWRRRHPDTLVLSPDTGHRRDYSEGAAYRDYFATDELMFTVPKRDGRLKNKDEVLALLFPQAPDQPLAISADYLARHPVYQDRIGSRDFVVLTDQSGANRVYETKGVVFSEWDQNRTVKDSQGTVWTLSEDRLGTADGRVLNRLPAHRAFWFGWFSAYTHTRLVH
ncbi:MAG: DUF3179 domain-containing protein [Candidatus Competibacteraceae bacterium]|nr:DUF3179 domain-containing protein [Candidatus Competibacteraceae bacterium]